VKNTVLALALISMVISGCNVSPFSPQNRPKIRNNGGEIGDMNSNQNGVMAEIMGLKNRLDVIAQDVENLQNGLINTNNRNFGVQIFHGEGGLAAGVVLLVALALLAANYKLKSDRYKKTAEIFGGQIKKMSNSRMEDELLVAAIEKKVEADVYRILKA
jgi:hypothetical protein